MCVSSGPLRRMSAWSGGWSLDAGSSATKTSVCYSERRDDNDKYQPIQELNLHNPCFIPSSHSLSILQYETPLGTCHPSNKSKALSTDGMIVKQCFLSLTGILGLVINDQLRPLGCWSCVPSPLEILEPNFPLYGEGPSSTSNF